MSEEGAVQVCVRMRPPNDREKSLQGGSAEALQIHWKADKQTVSQISGSRSFSFDRVFHPEESTATVYNEVAHSIVHSITKGYNGTIFAYGQTSSGKTYTMMGNAVSSGLIPLAICNLFNVINNTPNREFLLRVSYMEIYNESVSDLLVGPKRRPLEVREDMERTVYVANLTEELAVTYEDVMKLVHKGEKNRHYGETKMNEHSSRSHTIFRVIVESRDKNNEAVIVAHLNLVDLAGSERASQTGTEGVRLKEGCFINRSLFVLGQVIKKLSDGQAGGFLNYRDSKLTRILQNSLGGNAKTLIICTITPVSFEETLSTLQFASTAKFMKNTPHVNEVMDEQAMLKRCRKEIMDLKNQLEELTSETRVQAMEKAQLLSEKHILQMDHEQKIKNLTRMLVRVSTDDDQETKARRKRRVTWAPGKLRASFDSSAKMIKLDKVNQEFDEDDNEDDPFDVDSAWTSKIISECNSSITTKRGGSCGFQIPPFEDSLYFNEQSRVNTNCSSLLYDVSSKDELEQRISELEKELETLTEEREKEIKKEKFDAESLKMENDKQKEEIEELKERLEKAKFFQMENEKQKKEIKELEKLREGIEELKERREIEEFEFLEKEAEKEGKEQEQHENEMIKMLVRNSESTDQELEIKQLQQSLKDAEVVTRDAKKESSLLRSENLELKEEMNKMRVDYQRMENDVQSYSSQLDAERSRYKEMQSDLQKELNFVFNENTKLMSLLDGKVPKDLLDRFHLEKSMADLKQRLDKSEKEKNSLQEEVSLLSQYKSLPEKVDELAKQVQQLTEELNGVTSERDTLSECREDDVKQLENLRGELLSIVQDRNKLQEVLASVQSEQDHQEKIKTLQQDEMKCSLENLKNELDLYSVRLEEEKAKCAQFQQGIEDKERQIKEQEQQLKQELIKQKEIDDKYSKSSEEIKLLKEEKEELMIKLEVLMKTNEELTVSQSNSHQKVQALTKELQMLASQRDIKSENQELEVHDSSKQDTELQEQLFSQRLQQLQDEKSTLMKEKEDLQTILETVKIEKDAMKRALQGKTEMIQEGSEKLHCMIPQHDVLPAESKELRDQVSKESSADIQEEKLNWQLQQLKDENSSVIKEKDDLQVMLENVIVQRDEMESALQEKSERMQEQTEDLQRVMSQRDMLLGEIEELKASISKEQGAKIENEFNQRLQQIEAEYSLILKEKVNLQETVQCVKEERNEMKSTLQEITEKIQKQTEELHHVVSQRDVLFGVIQELRASISKEQKAEIQEKEFSERLQQLKNEKAAIAKQNDDLQAMLESIKLQRDEIKNTLQENTEKMREQSEKLHCVVAGRDALLGEIDQLRAQVSKGQSPENLGEKFNQWFQQFEDEKLQVIKEKEDLQGLLERVKTQSNEMMSTLQGNTEAIHEQTKELRRVVSHRDELLGEIEQLRSCVSKEQAVKIEEKKLCERLQQCEDEKSILAKEKCDLEETLESVKVQRDEMKRTLEENNQVLLKWTNELNGVRNHRDQLLVEIEQLKDEVKKVELLRQESNDQFERETKSRTMQKDELQLQIDKIQKDLCEKAEMLMIEQRRNEELKTLVATLEKQIVTWKEEKIQIVSTKSEADPVEAEINKLSNYLQEKDLLLQTAFRSLFELENEYKIGLAKTDQEFSREMEAWKELLLRICSEVPEGSAESIRIVKLQEENAKLYEKLMLWRSNFMRVMSTVPPRVKNYQKPIRKCDVSLADEKKKNEELLSQLQALKKQVSDPSELQLVSVEKNAEIRRISVLIASKEHHLENAQQNLLELKSKYQKYLTCSENGILSRAKARNNLKEKIAKQLERNILKIIEEIENENQILGQECQLQTKSVQSEAAYSESLRNGYIKYIRNSCDELENEKKKNDELLLQIEAVKQESLNKNGCDSLNLENQKLSKKLKEAELLLQNERIKINELEATLATSQEAYKQQEEKLSELQTEIGSKALEKNLDVLQSKLLKKDSQIKNLEESLEQLQAKLDMGAQPFKEEMTDLKNQLFALQMEKVKETKHLENQISSLKASLEHKEESLRQLKETLRRNQQEQDISITVENSKDKTCSTDVSLTCSAGSGIVQNAVVLVLNAEKAKLTRDLNQFKKENEHLARMVSELKFEKNIWKERATKHEEKDRTLFKQENIQHTLTQCPDDSLPSQSQKECSLPVSQNVEISKELFPHENKAAATEDKALENELPIDSSKASSFGMESQPWSLPRTKIFDNSRLSFPGAASPQAKPKYEKNERDDWWPKPSAADPECKMQ
ncbi:centromere-associated protein E isoform X2 [Chiloscyllium plagiosum]|uniref:centromere-associated protein E isoform X2 n=1 Tax=Chiloscyllium plagiosum TaxID=36176 RepID=UPI001CB7F1CB|nr:centromere-associated protein E isoform X2 [Chiloscyllium plagiosum]